ncbi:MAG: hypothetical protein V1720_15575 [bacterium]
MQTFRLTILFLLTITFAANSQQPKKFLEGLNQGKFIPGFRIEEKIDNSRIMLSMNDGTPAPRKIRVYIWYPSSDTKGKAIKFSDYVKYAAGDFAAEPGASPSDWPNIKLPVQLDKGLSREQLKSLWETEEIAVEGANPAKGKFPVIVMGQGLYYESPFSNFIICEYLASHGFVVVTSPLVGTQYRLVNINPVDLETQIRDMEFALSAASELPFVNREKIGIYGYDLGGISALIFCMRHPEVKALFSLDCSILYPHYTGLPNTHQNYNEENFTIPWMHLTQKRFVDYYKTRTNLTSLYERKRFGDSYLILIPTNNHGDFTSYSDFNISNPVPGYWDEVSANSKTISKIVCESAFSFFEEYLNEKPESIDVFKSSLEKYNNDEFNISFEMKSGQTPPPSESYFVNLIIEKGIKNSLPEIEKSRKVYADSLLFDESVLNWLGYYFLYWWGREIESIDLFKFITAIYPNSANAFDSFGEAYLVNGDSENAIKMYEKSLILNPENQNAKNQLEILKNQK